MTVVPDVSASAPTPAAIPRDHRGSWIPTGGMIATRFMELRKRRGVMAALIGVTIGIPTVFLAIRLLAHAIAPKTYGPAGGYHIFTAMTAGVLYVFGFIVAATLGCTAGSADLNEGMFRHLVVTGRSRLALYLARIPAGLAIIVPLVAAGFAIVCAVCAFAAPTTLRFDGVTVPAGLSQSGLERWAADHVDTVVCRLDPGSVQVNVPCANGPNGLIVNGPGPIVNGPGPIVNGPGPIVNGPGPIVKGPNGQIISGAGVPGAPARIAPSTPAQAKAAAIEIAKEDYSDYSRIFLSPSTSLMIKTGLWIELEAIIGFVVGLGLASLLGQRTIAVVMMVVLEIILTPIFARARIPHFANLQRAVVGLATAQLEPRALPLALGGARGVDLLPESTRVAVCVIAAWLVGWTVLGAWRMMTRDA